MSNEIFKIIFEEFKKNGIKLNDFEYRGDTFVADPLDIFNHPILREGETQPLLDFTEHDKPFKDKIAQLKKDYKTVSGLLSDYQQENESLKQRISEIENFSCQAEQESETMIEQLRERIAGLAREKTDSKHSLNEMEKIKSHLIDRAVEWQQKCEKLEGEKLENCEKEPISDDARPSSEWYENRYQQDCITINRLNTTIDVLIHKIEHLRQFAGLE